VIVPPSLSERLSPLTYVEPGSSIGSIESTVGGRLWCEFGGWTAYEDGGGAGMISVASDGSLVGRCLGWTGAGGAAVSSALTSSDNIYTRIGLGPSSNPLSEPSLRHHPTAI